MASVANGTRCISGVEVAELQFMVVIFLVEDQKLGAIFRYAKFVRKNLECGPTPNDS